MSVLLIFPKGYTLTLPQPLQGCGLLNVMALNEPNLATFFSSIFVAHAADVERGGEERKKGKGD